MATIEKFSAQTWQVQQKRFKQGIKTDGDCDGGAIQHDDNVNDKGRGFR